MASDQFTNIVEMMRARPQPDIEPSVEEIRAGFELFPSLFPAPERVTHTQVDVNGVPGEWVVAEGAAEDAAILFLHGGGYAIGSINTHRNLAAHVSREADMRVLLIDYRLAPEHPHPAAVDDAVTAWKWLLDGGLAPERLAIVGDSAGGGLTFATCIALRDEGLPLPAAAVPISPWVDLEGLGDSMTTKAEVDPMVQAAGLKRMADWYLDGQDARSPLAAPLYADLTGLPPMLIHVGGCETLLDDSVRIADKAKAAGVDCTLEVWDEMTHVWHIFAGSVPEADEAVTRVGQFIRGHIPQ